MRSLVFGLVIPSLLFREDTLAEKINLWRGKSSSGIIVVWEQIVATDLRTAVPELAIPVYFLEGRWDYTCSSQLAFEEPARLGEILRGDVLMGRTQLSDGAGER